MTRHALWMVLVLGWTIPLRAGDPPAPAPAPTEAAAAADEDAAEAPDTYSTRCVLDEVRVDIRRDGRKTRRLHRIVEVLKRDGLDAGDISIPYNDSRERARLVRAVTRTPDGREVAVDDAAVHRLLPRHFSEFQMYSDVRELAFSMPALQVGARLEYDVEIEEREALMPRQAWDWFAFDDAVPVDVARYVVTFPEDLGLRYVARRLDTPPAEIKRRGLVTWTWELRDLPAVKQEPGMPPAADVLRQVHLTTLASWDAVQDWFARLAADRLQDGKDVKAVVQRIVKPGMSRDEILRACSLFVQREIRYVGIELGLSAYQPHPAADVLRKHYGDCKDQATLLVSLLRLAGVPAHLALARPNYMGALVEDAPSPNQFVHCIVYVPPAGDQPARWLDPTGRYYDETAWPEGLDGTRSLVIGLDGVRLTTLPAPPAERALERRIYDVQLQPTGRCRVKEIEEYAGRAGAQQRRLFESMATNDLRKVMERHVLSMGDDARLIGYGYSEPHDLGEPFRNWVEYEADDFLPQADIGYSASVDAETLSSVLSFGPRKREGDAEPRRHDWLRPAAQAAELVQRLHLPAGYRAIPLGAPADQSWPWGAVAVAMRPLPDGVELRARVTALPARLAPDQLDAARAEVQEALSQANLAVLLADDARRQLALGHPAAAERNLKQRIAARPKPAAADVLSLGLFYRRCGRLQAARTAFQQAVRLEPAGLGAYDALAATWYGQAERTHTGFDRAAAAAVLQEAVERADDRKGARKLLAEVYEFDSRGLFQQPGDAPYAQSLAILDAMLKEEPGDVAIQFHRGNVLLAAGRPEEALQSYRLAFERRPDSLGIRDAVAKACAFCGRAGEAGEIVRSSYNTPSDALNELRQIELDLLRHRRYAEAAALIEQTFPLSEDAERVRRWQDLIARLAQAPRLDYSKPQPADTPRAAALEMFAAAVARDPARFAAGFASAAPLTPVDNNRFLYVARRLAAPQSGWTNYALDLLAGGWAAVERALPDGDVELRLIPPPDAEFIPGVEQPIVLQLTREGPAWKIIDFGLGRLDAGRLGQMAAAAADAGDAARAQSYADRILATAEEGEEGLGMILARLDDEPFPDEPTRLQAIIGAALSGSPAIGRSERLLRAAHAAAPAHRLLTRTLAALLTRAGAMEEGADLLRNLVRTHPRDVRSRRLLISLLEEMDGYDEAVAGSEVLEKLVPADPALALERFQLRVKAGQFEAAQKDLEAARPRLSPAQSRLLDVSLAAGRGATNELYRLADALPPAELDDAARSRLLSSFLIVGDLERAEEQAVCLLAANPTDGDQLLRLAQFRAAEGDLEEAAGLYEDASREPAQSGRSLFEMGQTAQMLGRYAEAVDRYDQVNATYDPRDAVYARLFSATVAWLQGDRARGDAYLDQAVNLQRDSVWPAPVLAALRGVQPFDDLRRQAEALASPLLRDNHLCELNFYAACQALGRGDREAARQNLDAALATRSLLTTEWFLARTLRRTLDAAPAAPAAETPKEE